MPKPSLFCTLFLMRRGTRGRQHLPHTRGGCGAFDGFAPRGFSNTLMCGNSILCAGDDGHSQLRIRWEIGRERVDRESGTVSTTQHLESSPLFCELRQEPELEAHRLRFHNGGNVLYFGLSEASAGFARLLRKRKRAGKTVLQQTPNAASREHGDNAGLAGGINAFASVQQPDNLLHGCLLGWPFALRTCLNEFCERARQNAVERIRCREVTNATPYLKNLIGAFFDLEQAFLKAGRPTVVLHSYTEE